MEDVCRSGSSVSWGLYLSSGFLHARRTFLFNRHPHLIRGVPGRA